MTTSIKITALADIGANVSYSTLVPVVDMTGAPVTDRANLQIIGNLILTGSGGSNFVAATRSLTSATVTNAAQANITSVGTLTALSVTGNITTADTLKFANLAVSGSDPVASGNSVITHKIPVVINGNTYYIALTATNA